MKTINCDYQTGIGDVQKEVKNLVEKGVITKNQGIIFILDATIKILESLKMPDGQSWDREEHGNEFIQTN